MKVLIDIPDDDYTSIRCEGLYCIGHDELDISVTTAFQNAVVYEENPNKWIPVSEKLPEKNMPCLLSVGKFHLTEIGTYSDLMGTIDHKIFWIGEYGEDDFRDVTEYVNAWMPLPEPYEAER